MSPTRHKITDLIALKLTCLFALRCDPGYIKLRNYNETDLYVKDGEIRLRIVVKDARQYYKDVVKTYVMTDEERTMLDHFMEKHPGRVYLFNGNGDASKKNIQKNYSRVLKRASQAVLGIEELSVSLVRKMVETKFGESIKGMSDLERERLWSHDKKKMLKCCQNIMLNLEDSEGFEDMIETCVVKLYQTVVNRGK
ncbi:hypothetical protein GGF31_003236 [Allomyces arbusculus]|nr:hypothetical protein GGF31_003236 [Allomyces arbusculus]